MNTTRNILSKHSAMHGFDKIRTLFPPTLFQFHQLVRSQALESFADLVPLVPPSARTSSMLPIALQMVTNAPPELELTIAHLLGKLLHHFSRRRGGGGGNYIFVFTLSSLLTFQEIPRFQPTVYPFLPPCTLPTPDPPTPTSEKRPPSTFPWVGVNR